MYVPNVTRPAFTWGVTGRFYLQVLSSPHPLFYFKIVSQLVKTRCWIYLFTPSCPLNAKAALNDENVDPCVAMATLSLARWNSCHSNAEDWLIALWPRLIHFWGNWTANWWGHWSGMNENFLNWWVWYDYWLLVVEMQYLLECWWCWLPYRLYSIINQYSVCFVQ